MTAIPFDEYDDERHVIEADQVGGPVDAPERKATFADVVSHDDKTRPIVPAVLRSPEGRRALVRWSARYGANRALYHVTRSPKYGIKVAAYAPRGVWRAGSAVLWWAAGGRENFHLRQEAANKNDPHTWQSLNRTRAKESSARWWVVGAALVLLLALLIGAEVAGMPPVGWYCVVAALVLVAARVGRPADKPIVDRVSTAAKFTKLTAEMVRGALVAVGAAKDPAALTFPPPGIHKDGPGWLARVNLPAGTEAVKVLEKRGALSSALRLPVDQVWPQVGPDHAGQLDLWVGYQPASKMGRAKWTLASDTARTSMFEPIPFAVDQRKRPIATTPFQRNFLVGGQPGSGKTFAGRALVLGALLDPTCEVWLAAFKASEDFYDVSEFCTRYVCGVDEQTMSDAERMVADGLREVRRRQTLLGKLKRDGKIAEGVTNAELASKGIGLHPLLLVFDEVHELFAESDQAADDMTRLIKQGRSAGVMVVLITQVAGAGSVPTEITRCVSSRWCLSVADQVANDQIMGTGAYKRGVSGTAYRPEVDAGWGATMGMAGTYVGPARAYYPNQGELETLVERIRVLRGGRTFSTDSEQVKARDMLADARAVLLPGESGLPWAVLAERLAAGWPEMYAGITPDMVRESLARYGVESQDVKVGRKNIKGARRASLDAAQQRREIEAE
ncbi:cell division protein FtsK [Micromonospora aurantiaca]|uniref:cell division protein FtsK n=1 Tax=Micromonospora aurantiaca (nom. illeg.) TaxID=47850 RepID=UPI0034443EBD